MVDYLKFDESNTTQTMTTKYLYTALGQLKEIKYTNDNTSATMEKYTYTYDKRGNIVTEYIYNTYGGTTSLTKEYVYNSRNMLTETTVGSDETSYAYDATGNRYYEGSRQGAENEWYDKYLYYTEFDQLEYATLNISNGAQTVEEYEYNTRGALTLASYRNYSFYDAEKDEWTPIIRLDTVYTYDKAGMLQKTYEEVENNTVYKTTGHFYNGMEQRVRKIVDGTTTKYIYAGSELLFTTDGNNAKITENVLSTNGQIIASQRFEDTYAGNYYFYNQDIRSSTMSIVSESYSAVKYYKYNEYGKMTTEGLSTFKNSETYTGAVVEGRQYSSCDADAKLLFANVNAQAHKPPQKV